jgi:hypothetical protein
MLGNYRVSKELGISRVVLSSMELVRVPVNSSVQAEGYVEENFHWPE